MRVASLFLLLAVGLVSGGAQSSAPRDAGVAQSQINVQATTSSGSPVSTLVPGDFNLLVNQHESRIVAVKAASPRTEPVHVILLLDAVNVSYTELSYERTQLLQYLRANGGKLAVPTTLAVLTNTGIQMQQGFSQDGNLLAKGLDEHSIGFRTITRAAGFWGVTERVETSANSLRALCTFAGNLPGRKFVLWISPGWPLLSGPEVQLSNKQQDQIFRSIVQMSDKLREANITLYSLNALGANEDVARANFYRAFTKGVTKPGDAEVGNLGLQVLALQSGGLALQGSTDLVSMIESCLKDTAAWYVVQFEPNEGEEKTFFHRIELKTDKPDVRLRTRQGYYVAQ